MNKPEEILTVRNLAKRYGPACPACVDGLSAPDGSNLCPTCSTVHAVRDVSMTLHRGEILGIIGESGSGKSTLLKMMVFDEHASRGEILYHDAGTSVNTLLLNAAQKRNLRNQNYGIVYQNPQLGLNFRVSAGGNIAERLLMKGTRDFNYIRQRSGSLLARAEVPVQRMDERPLIFRAACSNVFRSLRH